MYLTAVDLHGSETVPTQTPDGVRTGGLGPLPCPGALEARTWGQTCPAVGNTRQTQA